MQFLPKPSNGPVPTGNVQVRGSVKTLCRLLVAVLACNTSLTAQYLQGRVIDDNNNAVPGASVQVEELQTGLFTDLDGHYTLKFPKAGTYTVKASLLGYQTRLETLSVGALETKTFTFVLEPADAAIDEVVVKGKTELQSVREQAYHISAIDMKPLQNTTASINDALNRTSGIRIREEGGLGSNFTFSLNGFTGKQVKFFIDGIPMDYFGPSMTLNNLPVNMAERIEIYKGVVPISLGSDALGGAVNVVTNAHVKNYADVSYSIGSFNTHQAAFNTRHTGAKSGFQVNANGFYNYSDNDYKVDVRIANPQSGKYDAAKSIPRFHDAYRSAMGQIEMGVTDKPWADKLMAGIIYSENRKEIQHGLNMDEVAGEAFTSGQSVISTLKYKKTDLFTEGLSLVANGVYSKVEDAVTDTSSREYDWLGHYTLKTFGVTSGEISYNKTLFRFNDDNAVVTSNLTYRIMDRHVISANYVYNYYRRQGEDPISPYPIPFQEPNTIGKNIGGMAYEYNSGNRKWTATAFVKLYQMTASTVDAEWGDYLAHEADYLKKGFGTAIVSRIAPQVQIKASFESCWRLPEGDEMFGDGLLLQNNAFLRPEHSNNVNLGIMARTQVNQHKLEGELNLIYRQSSDFIRLESDGILSTYSNLDSVRTTGVELAAKYTYNKFYMELNGTYQNLINTNGYDDGIKSAVHLDRLPNIPYLFGNVDAGMRLNNLIGDSDLLTISAGLFYVEQFYLFWPSQGSTGSKFYIPRQVTGRGGVSYSLKKRTYNLALECTNIGNAKVYDNFSLQKPGRAFHLKFRYYIGK